MDSNKKYGLIIRKSKPALKTGKQIIKPSSLLAFNDSSSDEDARKEINSQIHKEARKKIMKKQTKLEIQRALEQDATVYDYDNIYDEMKKKSNEKSIPENVIKADRQKKPKYMTSLLKAAENRNKERQRVEERKIERDRENEGDEFKHKPAFVTSAYKKRMEERQKEEEDERKMAYIEDVMDVKKQKDLSGFYKHLLQQQVGESESSAQRFERKLKQDEEKKNNEEENVESLSSQINEDADLSLTSSDDEDQTEELESSDLTDTLKSTIEDNLVNEENNKINDNKFKKRADEDTLSDARQRYFVRQKEKQPQATNSAGNNFEKRTSKDAAALARERYLARKGSAQHISKNDSD